MTQDKLRLKMRLFFFACGKEPEGEPKHILKQRFLIFTCNFGKDFKFPSWRTGSFVAISACKNYSWKEQILQKCFWKVGTDELSGERIKFMADTWAEKVTSATRNLGLSPEAVLLCCCRKHYPQQTAEKKRILRVQGACKWEASYVLSSDNKQRRKKGKKTIHAGCRDIWQMWGNIQYDLKRIGNILWASVGVGDFLSGLRLVSPHPVFILPFFSAPLLWLPWRNKEGKIYFLLKPLNA